jgi:hypothetical protein
MVIGKAMITPSGRHSKNNHWFTERIEVESQWRPNRSTLHCAPFRQPPTISVTSRTAMCSSDQAVNGSVIILLVDRTYSEIVWLRTDWTASTRANANRTTGLPNSYGRSRWILPRNYSPVA